MDHKEDYLKNYDTDVKGVLNLYEATYLSFEGENILDEARTFTKTLLNQLHTKTPVVTHALELPLHHRMVKLEARWFIETYSKRRDYNPLLLELAKLDFNMVQSLLQTELKDVSRYMHAQTITYHQRIKVFYNS